MEEALYFNATDRTIYIRATGHVTAALCPPLKARVFSRLDQDPSVEAIYFDLSDCEYMDSTFLGLIVGTQKRFERASHRRVSILRTSDACLNLLRTIGVLRMVDLSDEAIPFPETMENVAESGRTSARYILEAHQDLSDLSDENRARFSTLTSLLKESIDSEGSKP